MTREVPRILLTGAPQAGKTTLVCRLARELQATGVAVQGFTTSELREQGHRVGFLVQAIGGESAIMAHVARNDGPQVAGIAWTSPPSNASRCPHLSERMSAAAWRLS